MLSPTEILHLNAEEWLKGKNPTNINVLLQRQEVNAKTGAAQLPGISLSLRTTHRTLQEFHIICRNE